MRFVSLGSVADIQLGKMLSPKSKTGNHLFPYLRNQNVQWQHFDLTDMATMDFSQQEREKFKLLPGDLLVCEGGEPGRCAVWGGNREDCYYQKALHRVRPKKGVADSEFLALWLRFQALTGAFEDQNSKTTIAHLPLVRLKQLPVPSLDVDEQIEISARLKSNLAEVEVARQAAVMQLNDVSRLADSFVFDSVERSETTKHSLSDVLVEIKSGIGKTWTEYPVLGATRNGLAPAKEPPGKLAQKYKPAFPGTVFYNPMRILIGSIAFVDEDDTPGITSPDYVVLKGKDGVVDSRWFYFWLRSPLGEKCISALARGAVRERMLFNRLAEGEIYLPSFSSQKQTSGALTELKHMRNKLKLQLSEIDLLSQKLLSRAFENRHDREEKHQ